MENLKNKTTQLSYKSKLVAMPANGQNVSEKKAIEVNHQRMLP